MQVIWSLTLLASPTALRREYESCESDVQLRELEDSAIIEVYRRDIAFIIEGVVFLFISCQIVHGIQM